MAKNILIFTGNGKGKSTAAFGMAIRAAGHGQKVLILQYMKSDDSTGEIASLRKLGIDIRQTGLGFVPKPDHPKYLAHREAAQQGFALAVEELKNGSCDLVVLDEICGAIGCGLIEQGQVLDVLCAARDTVNIVLTGRNASPALIEKADTVSEMVPHKHALEQGIPARKGVEF